MSRGRVMVMPFVIAVALAMGTVWADPAKHKVQVSQNAPITKDAAIKSATDRVPGKVLEVELTRKADTILWEVEIASANNTIMKIHIDALTGAIINMEQERRRKDNLH